MRNRVTVLTFSIALLWGSTPAISAADQYFYLTGTAVRGSGDDTSHGLAAGVLVCEQKLLRPIALFGAAKPSAGKSQFLFLLIFKTAPDFDARSAFGSSVSGRGSSQDGVEGTMAVELAKKKVEVAYKFPTDPKSHAVLKQSLTVGGQEIKEGDPRVFVVDLTGDKVTYTAVKVELPKDVPDVSQEKNEEWGAAVQRAIDQLKKDSAELKKLLDSDTKK
jgi:hypothetical protein